MDKAGFCLITNLLQISLEGFCNGEYESGKDYINHLIPWKLDMGAN